MIPLLLNVGFAAPVRLALVVTTNEGLAAEEPLKFADSDGDHVAEMLAELGGFEAQNVLRVRDATRETLERGLRDAVLTASRMEESGIAVELFVYYTGHAGPTGLHLQGEALPLAELKAAARVVPAVRRIFVIDACQSGRFMRSRGARLAVLGDAPEGFEPPVEEAWITSSGPEENAFEVDQRRGALFTHFFVSGARGAADADGDGAVTLSELYGYAQGQTSAEAARNGVVQQPRWAGDHGEWTLTTPGRSSSGLEAIGPIREPLLVVRRDTQSVEAELPAGAGGRLALPSGRYQLISVFGGRPRVADVVIGRDGWRSVQLERELLETRGVRSRGGLVVRRLWTITAGYSALVGGIPGTDLAHGGWLGVDRVLGRGHSAGLVVSGAQGTLDNDWVAGRGGLGEVRLVWAYDVVDRSVRLSPALELGGGLMGQRGARKADTEWGAWFGEASAATASRVGFGRAEVGGRATVAVGPLVARTWLGFGGTAFGDRDRTVQPTMSIRVGMGVER